ncbi:WD40-repeat-containing domain protein [Dichomitus squalens]|uniref:WD40-repeat-containing domain protein n=1 Tax=Dichomitus squalens TaxID=114155 RepID=A0A4Q9PHN2_9APHY|nr:WD40-repeat-containing domain protein [Dichomitus squalens]
MRSSRESPSLDCRIRFCPELYEFSQQPINRTRRRLGGVQAGPQSGYCMYICGPDTGARDPSCSTIGMQCSQFSLPSTMAITRHTPAFPFDILENIIDLLHSDLTSLCALSLTCRILLPRSRYHRLRSISLKSQDEIYSFGVFLARNPPLKQFIFAVALGGEVDVFMPSYFRTMSQLPKLHTLTISMPSRDFTRPKLFVAFHPTLLKVIRTSVTAIETLCLQGIFFKSPVELGRIIMAFPRLRALHVATSCFASLKRYPPVAKCPPPIVRLTVDGIDSDVINWLLEYTGNTLQDLTLSASEGSTFNLARSPKLSNITYATPYTSNSIVKSSSNIVTTLRTSENSSQLHVNIHFLGCGPRSLLGLSSPATSIEGVEALDEEIAELRLLRVSFCMPHQKRNRARWYRERVRDIFPRLTAQTLTDICPEGVEVGHDAQVCSVSFSPDGKWIATAAQDRTVILWELGYHSAMRDWIIDDSASVESGTVSIAFSPKGRWLASSGAGKTIKIWDAEVTDIDKRHADLVHDSTVATFAWQSAGITLVSVANDGIVRLWDTETLQEIRKLIVRKTILRDTYSRPPGTVVFSPFGCLVLYYNCDSSSPVQVWDMNTGRGHELLSPPSHSCQPWGMTQAACFSPDGRHIATASKDGVRIWRTDDGARVIAVAFHSLEVGDTSYLGFSQDGRVLVSADTFGAVHMHPLKHLIRGWPDV